MFGVACPIGDQVAHFFVQNIFFPTEGEKFFFERDSSFVSTVRIEVLQGNLLKAYSIESNIHYSYNTVVVWIS